MILPDKILEITHMYTKAAVCEGDTVVDATAGNGHDTVFLAGLVGSEGKVFSFDIQQQAVQNTKERVINCCFENIVEVIKDGHQNMKNYVSEASAVMFNLGYLPGGDHSIGTVAETTIPAICAALDIIKVGGIVSIGIYYGGDSGFDEKNAVIEFLKTVESPRYNLIMFDYINRPNCPPIAVVIEKKF